MCPKERVAILKALVRKRLINPSVYLSAIAQMEARENFTGADLKAVVSLILVPQEFISLYVFNLCGNHIC